IGTPDYLAPEQVIDSRKVDVRADVYSLGCTLYFLLAGRPPFPEGGPLEKALAHVDVAPRAIREIRPEVSPELAAVLERMMAKSPDDRHQTPGDAALALAEFAQLSPARPSKPRSSDTASIAPPRAEPSPPPAPRPKAKRSQEATPAP